MPIINTHGTSLRFGPIFYYTAIALFGRTHRFNTLNSRSPATRHVMQQVLSPEILRTRQLYYATAYRYKHTTHVCVALSYLVLRKQTWSQKTGARCTIRPRRVTQKWRRRSVTPDPNKARVQLCNNAIRTVARDRRKRTVATTISFSIGQLYSERLQKQDSD